jgi:ABC-type sugar transport system substrate-binding protein
LAAAEYTFAWFANGTKEQVFWKQHLAITQAAAKDLNIAISQHFAQTDQIRFKHLLREAVKSKAGIPKNDALIFGNVKNQGSAIMDIIEQGNIPGVLNVSRIDYKDTGMPRERYSNWVGEIYVDEIDAGYRLANSLIKTARAKNLYSVKDDKIHLLAITGVFSEIVAIQRKQGLMKAVREHDDVVLEHQFDTKSWTSKAAYKIAQTALRRYPETTVVWGANDDIALGVIEAARSIGLKSGDDFIIGGIDGTLELIKKIVTGEAHATVAGLSFHGAWATIILHDYLHGEDFAEGESTVLEVEASLIDQKNAQAYLQYFGDDNWDKIDFSQFSKVLNPDLQRYNFSVNGLIKQVTAQ